MIHRHIDDSPLLHAGDKTHLKELLHPAQHAVSIPFSLAHAFILPGDQSLPHVLSHSETYYFLQGDGIIHVNGEKANIKPGSCVWVPAQANQWVENTGNEKLVFLCIVDPAWDPSCESITQTT